jgi:hypothetical protein
MVTRQGWALQVARGQGLGSTRLEVPSAAHRAR